MAVYTLRCPVCKKLFSSNVPGELVCTGPSEMRHDHELTIMKLVKVENAERFYPDQPPRFSA